MQSIAPLKFLTKKCLLIAIYNTLCGESALLYIYSLSGLPFCSNQICALEAPRRGEYQPPDKPNLTCFLSVMSAFSCISPVKGRSKKAAGKGDQSL